MFAHAVIINPNESMIKMFSFSEKPRFENGKTGVTVYSQAVLSAEEKESIAKLVSPISVNTAAALNTYSQLKGIF